jgi:hypothetical protein
MLNEVNCNQRNITHQKAEDSRATLKHLLNRNISNIRPVKNFGNQGDDFYFSFSISTQRIAIARRKLFSTLEKLA